MGAAFSYTLIVWGMQKNVKEKFTPRGGEGGSGEMAKASACLDGKSVV